MSRVIFLRGLSGSGKSTWSNNYQRQHPDETVLVINRDKIRALCFGSEEAYGVDEDLVTVVANALLDGALKSGRDYDTIIIDNTHIYPAFIEQAIERLPKGTPVEVVMMPLDLPLALAQNDLRKRAGGRGVPEKVILAQYNQLNTTKDWKPDDKR